MSYAYDTVKSGYKAGTNLAEVQNQFFTQNTNTGPFDGDIWRDYLRYITIEIALGGMFVTHTPKEILRGYKEPLITKIKNTPVYAGGDPTQNDVLALIEDFSDSNLAFFTGTDDYKLVKSYAEYNGSPNVRILAPYRIGNGTTATKVAYNPWREDIALKGTDASLFSPLLEEGQPIWAFVSDIMIPLRFLYQGTSTKYGLEAFRYELDPQMLENSSKFPRNHAFYIDKYDGFANLTSQRGAKVFICQPHYFQVPSVFQNITSVILDRVTGKEINPSHANDQSYFYLEEVSGGQLEGY